MATPEEKAEYARQRVRDYIFHSCGNVQKDFARKAGFAKSNRLSDFLAGKTAVPEDATLRAYAAAMGLTLEEMTAPPERSAPTGPAEALLDYEDGVIGGMTRTLGKALVIATLEAAAGLDDPAEAPAVLRRARAARGPRPNGSGRLEPSRKDAERAAPSRRKPHRGGA